MKNLFAAIVAVFVLATSAATAQTATDGARLPPLPAELKGRWYRADSPAEEFNKGAQSGAWEVAGGKLKFDCSRGRTNIQVAVTALPQGVFGKGAVWRVTTQGQFYDNRCEINWVEFWQEGGQWVGRADASPFYPYFRTD